MNRISISKEINGKRLEKIIDLEPVETLLSVIDHTMGSEKARRSRNINSLGIYVLETLETMTKDQLTYFAHAMISRAQQWAELYQAFADNPETYTKIHEEYKKIVG
ncbi:hypothetical protein COT72_01490 [archaeon CG10_big_fil_rev_8_21_14_0_10_43_11]|nr:MAG: hypothetical protein COT72_01490 [archaeon CG10_big_fil_rev_8_21_14_0_10_43_11]